MTFMTSSVPMGCIHNILVWDVTVSLGSCITLWERHSFCFINLKPFNWPSTQFQMMSPFLDIFMKEWKSNCKIICADCYCFICRPRNQRCEKFGVLWGHMNATCPYNWLNVISLTFLLVLFCCRYIQMWNYLNKIVLFKHWGKFDTGMLNLAN